jgi:hypothetical protein
MEIKMTETDIFIDVLYLYARVYHHEECSAELKDFIELELRRLLKKDIVNGILQK